MTDRLKGVYVAFDQDFRTDDAEVIISAIRQIRGVAAVEVSVSNMDDWMNRERIRNELRIKLFDALKDGDR